MLTTSYNDRPFRLQDHGKLPKLSQAPWLDMDTPEQRLQIQSGTPVTKSGSQVKKPIQSHKTHTSCAQDLRSLAPASSFSWVIGLETRGCGFRHIRGYKFSKAAVTKEARKQAQDLVDEP